ncbi:TPA: redox-regulated ATPase YchF, partial [Candidatus Bathyarchaeota archaeon]|nr:redox-regulated ATPase YchF [Candidatus Bathyarchaeota archaeon]
MPPLLGIVGRTNTGKSTFFSAATLVSVPIASFPFTTIKPNRGIGYVRMPCVCRDLNVRDDPKNSLCIKGDRLIPFELLDCPGLIRGAHMGRGLGNRFLDELRKADALIVVCDAAGATDDEGRPCRPGTHDPVDDVRMIEYEYDMWLLQLVEKEWGRIVRRVESMREKFTRLVSERLLGLGVTEEHVSRAVRNLELDASRPGSWKRDDLRRFVTEMRRLSKPFLVAANKVDLPMARENIDRLRREGYLVVPCCAEGELILRRAASKGLIEYNPGDEGFTVVHGEAMTPGQMKALEAVREVIRGWKSTGVQQAINTAFSELLKMIVVYPVENAVKLTDHDGNVLPDAYPVPQGTTARDLAYLVHTELGDTFLYAIDARTKKRL